MNTDFEDIMSNRTDEELIKIVTVDKDDYQPLAVVAAEEEIKKRNLDTARIEETENELTVQIEVQSQLDNKMVSSSTRFLHFIIDRIICLIIASGVSVVLSPLVVLLSFLLFPTAENEGIELLLGFLYLLLIIVCHFFYCYIMEVRYQKTVAKFITKTKVVTSDGNIPGKGHILQRTFCRLIPFDAVSFLFTKNGLHDRFSDTRVIKDDPASAK